jgi:GNAT superfamily N-acetyltransferase
MTQLVSASDYDWDALTALYNRTRSDYLVPMQMTPDKMAEYARIYDVSLNHSFVALDDDTGDQVGVGMLGLRPGRAWITRLGVLPSQRGKGTARRIVEALIGAAWDAGVDFIQLEYITGNDAAGRLFESVGFTPIGGLVVMERGAGLLTGDIPRPSNAVSAMTPDEIAAALASRDDRPSWIIQTESLLNAGSLTGWRSGESWMVCHHGGSLLTHFAFGRLGGSHLCRAMFAAMHNDAPTQTVKIENLSDDDYLHLVLQGIGYTVAFRRTEMVLRR